MVIEGGREGGRDGGREGHQMPLALDVPQVQLVIIIIVTVQSCVSIGCNLDCGPDGHCISPGTCRCSLRPYVYIGRCPTRKYY